MQGWITRKVSQMSAPQQVSIGIGFGLHSPQAEKTAT